MGRRITLTFDNGPDERVTPAVLDLLAKHALKSTFFVLGAKAERPAGGELIQRALAEGHWVGNHTFSHRKPLGLLPADEAVKEFLDADAAIAAAAGRAGVGRKLFRPYGGGGKIGAHLLQPVVVEQMKRLGYTCVLWNCVPGDWRDPEGWLARALADVEMREWSLVVLHDISVAAMAHLDEFLTELKRREFEFSQAFPPDCLPMVDGVSTGPLEAICGSGV